MRNNKVKLAVLISALLIIGVLIAVAVTVFQDAPEHPESIKPSNSQSNTPSDPEEIIPSDPEVTTPSDPEATIPSDPEATIPSDPEATIPSDPEATIPSDPEATIPSDPEATTPSDPEATTPSAPQPSEPQNPDDPLSFPYAIPGTNLVIQSVRSYDGIFVEDGSNTAVTGISTMVLVNTGETGVEFAEITLHQGSTALHYKAICIPAGATLVVQESSAAKYIDGKYTACTANVAEAKTFEMSETLVKVEEIENGTLLVTNLTDKKIPCVRVFYKFAFEKGQIYVGGITYTVELTDLEPGQSKKVTASHFAAGASEIVMVRTYGITD